MKTKKAKAEKVVVAAAMLTALLFGTDKSTAQLKGHHLLGDYGLNAGTQPSPSIIAASALYWYRASELKNNNGDVIARPDIKVFFVGAGGSVVTNLKILNANYGFSVLAAFMTNTIEGNLIEGKIPIGYTDTYVQPIQLGWHCKKADFSAGYALYIPTGEYERGGESNNGLGMWTNEFSAGATVYFDENKKWSFASIFFYEIHTNKKNSFLRTGDIFTAEGGAGKAFYKKIDNFPLPVIFNVGPIYYAQFKVGDDRIPIGNRAFTGRKDRIWAGGLEANILHPKLRTMLGFRWLHEFGAKNRFEGDAYLVNIGFIIKSLEKNETTEIDADIPK